MSRVGKRYGERFISPAVQREEIATWAHRRGVVLLRMFEEMDESGARANRPLLQEAIRRVESGQSDGLVVSKVNRFGRSLIDGLVAIERIRDAGGTFYSVHDGFDSGTDAGRLVLRIMLSMAEWDIDRARADWAVARERAISRGVSLYSSVPVGYRKTRSGRLLPHPRTGPLIVEVFRRRAASEPIPRLCLFLESEKVLTGHGNPGWVPSVLHRVIKNRVYLGEKRDKGRVFVGSHPALIDPATWERAQQPRPLFHHYEPHEPLLLTGLARCAGCSMRLSAKRQDAPILYYTCKRHFSGGRCPTPGFVKTSRLDDYVLDAFYTLLGRRRDPPVGEISAMEERLSQVSHDLSSYRDNDNWRRMLGDDAFTTGVATRVERVREARLKLSDTRSRIEAHALPSADEIRDQWPTLDVIARRALIARVIDCVFLAKGRGPMRSRVTVCPIGTAPRYLLPVGGPKAAKLRTIQPRRGWMNPETAD